MMKHSSVSVIEIVVATNSLFCDLGGMCRVLSILRMSHNNATNALLNPGHTVMEMLSDC